MNPRTAALLAAALSLLSAAGCKRSAGAELAGTKIGLVTDVGGRGDQSFNDGALRGLEMWASGHRYTTRGYAPLSAQELLASVPDDVRELLPVQPLAVRPVVLQAKQQEDYEPNLELLVEDGAKLAIGVGYMLENAVETAARSNPEANFLLIDSEILDAQGRPYELPNVKTITFREHEGTFLIGALAGLVTKSNVVGFVGGMEIPLIRKFEVGFRAGLAATNPEAAKRALIGYTGHFDKVELGKQVAQDMISKGADVLFHASGTCGLGVIAAAKESGKWAVGCDSDQYAVAPDTVLTSIIKHVDLAVYLAARDVLAGKLATGHQELGLKEGGVGYAPVRSERLPDKAAVLARVEALRKQVISGELKVPANHEELAGFAAGAERSAR